MKFNENEINKNFEKFLTYNFQKYVGLITKKTKIYCYRCGNDKLFFYKKHCYCANCKEFKRVDQNTVFYQINPLKINFLYKDCLTDLKLTEKQLIASLFINSCLKLQKDCLIHAVCGAGKTEITFNAISQKLKENKFVAFAIPRIDILYEVYQRLKYYFYQTEICIMNSQETRIQNGQLYIMTTNQIIKFKKAFELIIVDEIDAFPYEHNPKFDYGVHAAKTKTGSIIYLTSTPSQHVLEQKYPTYIINRRWHNNLLPIPQIKFFSLDYYLRTKIGNDSLIKRLREYNKSENKKQLLIFIGNINKGKKVQNKLKKRGIRVDFIYSSESKRKDFIQTFRAGKKKILLTTTILERGVTFKNIDVIVLDADSPLYTTASLIQIAGRVNRNLNYQKGNIYFYCEKKTQEIKQSIKEIKKLNR